MSESCAEFCWVPALWRSTIRILTFIPATCASQAMQPPQASQASQASAYPPWSQPVTAHLSRCYLLVADPAIVQLLHIVTDVTVQCLNVQHFYTALSLVSQGCIGENLLSLQFKHIPSLDPRTVHKSPRVGFRSLLRPLRPLQRRELPESQPQALTVPLVGRPVAIAMQCMAPYEGKAKRMIRMIQMSLSNLSSSTVQLHHQGQSKSSKSSLNADEGGLPAWAVWPCLACSGCLVLTQCCNAQNWPKLYRHSWNTRGVDLLKKLPQWHARQREALLNLDHFGSILRHHMFGTGRTDCLSRQR